MLDADFLQHFGEKNHTAHHTFASEYLISIIKPSWKSLISRKSRIRSALLVGGCRIQPSQTGTFAICLHHCNAEQKHPSLQRSPSLRVCRHVLPTPHAMVEMGVCRDLQLTEWWCVVSMQCHRHFWDLSGINLHPLLPRAWQKGERSLRGFFKQRAKLGERTRLSSLALCPSCLRIS